MLFWKSKVMPLLERLTYTFVNHYLLLPICLSAWKSYFCPWANYWQRCRVLSFCLTWMGERCHLGKPPRNCAMCPGSSVLSSEPRGGAMLESISFGTQCFRWRNWSPVNEGSAHTGSFTEHIRDLARTRTGVLTCDGKNPRLRMRSTGFNWSPDIEQFTESPDT